MSKTKHLDTALEILKGRETSRRAKGTTFTLYAIGYESDSRCAAGILQGPRGKTVVEYTWRPWAEIEAAAKAHVARVPGATLTIHL